MNDIVWYIAAFILGLPILYVVINVLLEGPSWLFLGPWLPAFLDPRYLAAKRQHNDAVTRYDVKIATGWTPEEICNGRKND